MCRCLMGVVIMTQGSVAPECHKAMPVGNLHIINDIIWGKLLVHTWVVITVSEGALFPKLNGTNVLVVYMYIVLCEFLK